MTAKVTLSIAGPVQVSASDPLRMAVTTAQRGAKGASAYEVAVASGFVGTPTQWTDSLGFSLGSNVTAVVALTQAEYEALSPKSSTTLYLITA